MTQPAGSNHTDPLWPPAPDREPGAQATQTSSWSWQGWVLLLVVGGVAGYQLGPWLGKLVAGHGFAILAGVVIGVWINVILHEAGHALAGLARGMRILSLGVGPIRIERGVAGWRTRWGGGIGGIAGFACLVPGADRTLSKADQIIYLLGGPVANLMTAALGLLVVSTMEAGTAAAFLLALSLSAALLGLINLLSFEAGGFRSDGCNVLAALRDRPEALLTYRHLQLMQLSQAGVRPRDWPLGLIPEPVDDVSPILAMNADLLRLTWAIDRRDGEQAEQSALRLVPMLHRVPPVFRPHVAICVASYIALMRPDPARLEAWLPWCEGGLTDLSPLHAWLHGEHAALIGRFDQAAEQIAQARAESGRLNDQASIALLHEYLDALAARLPVSVDQKDRAVSTVEV